MLKGLFEGIHALVYASTVDYNNDNDGDGEVDGDSYDEGDEMTNRTNKYRSRNGNGNRNIGGNTGRKLSDVDAVLRLLDNADAGERMKTKHRSNRGEGGNDVEWERTQSISQGVEMEMEEAERRRSLGMTGLSTKSASKGSQSQRGINGDSGDGGADGNVDEDAIRDASTLMKMRSVSSISSINNPNNHTGNSNIGNGNDGNTMDSKPVMNWRLRSNHQSEVDNTTHNNSNTGGNVFTPALDEAGQSLILTHSSRSLPFIRKKSTLVHVGEAPAGGDEGVEGTGLGASSKSTRGIGKWSLDEVPRDNEQGLGGGDGSGRAGWGDADDEERWRWESREDVDGDEGDQGVGTAYNAALYAVKSRHALSVASQRETDPMTQEKSRPNSHHSTRDQHYSHSGSIDDISRKEDRLSEKSAKLKRMLGGAPVPYYLLYDALHRAVKRLAVKSSIASDVNVLYSGDDVDMTKNQASLSVLDPVAGSSGRSLMAAMAKRERALVRSLRLRVGFSRWRSVVRMRKHRERIALTLRPPSQPAMTPFLVRLCLLWLIYPLYAVACILLGRRVYSPLLTALLHR